MNKIVVAILAMVLVTSMAYAGVASSGLLWAKKSHESVDKSSDSGTSGPSHSGDSGSSGNDNGDNGKTNPPSDIGTQPPTGDQQTEKPTDQQTPVVTDKPITPANDNDKPVCMIESCGSQTPDQGCAFHPNSINCKPDSDGNCPSGFAHNDKGNCFPEGPCPQGSSRHDDDESGQCFHNPKHCINGFANTHPCPTPGNFCHFHNCGTTHTTVVVHKTKVVHKKDLIGIPTVFVPKIGLVEPFNCKLNTDNGKIGCEFIVIKVIN